MIHEMVLKRIGRYLKGTQTKGMIVWPTKDLNLDYHFDFDFAGLQSFENYQGIPGAKRRTGYIMLLGEYPLMWSNNYRLK